MRSPGMATALAALVLLAGCANPAAATAPPSIHPAAAPPTAVSTAPVVAVPASMSVPAIGATSTLIPLGLNLDHTVQVPSLATPLQAGWYTGASRPGDPGPAVLLGHVDSHGHQGIFYRLKDVRAGDRVLVTRADGSVATFVVTRTETVAKKDFPTVEVYGMTPGPTLRLITCGGVLDTAAHNYLSSVIVFADLAT